MKHDQKYPLVRYLLSGVELLSMLALAVCFGALALRGRDGQRGQEFYRQTQREYTVSPETGQPLENAPEERSLTVDFAGLRAGNEEIVGWLEIPRLELSYPILQAEDNEKYLHTMYTGEYNRAGSIFMDAGNDSGLGDALTILYGHNMDNGSMFARLTEYRDPGFGKSTDRVYIYLPGHQEPLAYQPFACCQLAADDRFYFTDYRLSTSEYGEFQTRMLYSSPDFGEIVPAADQPTLALSTCTKDGKQRVVLFAARIMQ